jgi:hypothetical protein
VIDHKRHKDQRAYRNPNTDVEKGGHCSYERQEGPQAASGGSPENHSSPYN